MNKSIIFWLVLVSILVLGGCENIKDEDLETVLDRLIVCEKPYIRYASGCCLDENENRICDKDETGEITKPKEEPLLERCLVSTGSGIFCDDFIIDTSGITLRLKNILPESINVESIVTNEGKCESGSGIITAGETADFLISCSLLSGKKIDKDFTINYTVGGNLKTTGGTVSGIVAEKTPEQLLPEKCVISTGSGLFCDDFSVDSNAQVRINLKNMLTEDISAVTVTLTNGGGGTGSCTNAAPAAITADGVTVVTLACDPTLSAKVKGDLSITYTVGGFTKTTTGSISGMVP